MILHWKKEFLKNAYFLAVTKWNLTLSYYIRLFLFSGTTNKTKNSIDILLSGLIFISFEIYLSFSIRNKKCLMGQKYGSFKTTFILKFFFAYFDFACRSVFNKTFIGCSISQHVKTTTYLHSQKLEIYHTFLNLSVPFYVTKPLIQIEKMKSIVIETFSSCVIYAISWQDMYGCIPFFRYTISLNVSDKEKIRYKNDYSTLGWKPLWLKSPLMKVYHNWKIIPYLLNLQKGNVFSTSPMHYFKNNHEQRIV